MKAIGFRKSLAITEGDALVDFDAASRRVLQVPGVVRAAPIVNGQALATGGGPSPGVIVRGIRAGDLKTLTDVSK